MNRTPPPTPGAVPDPGTPAPADQLEAVLGTPIAIDGTQQAFGTLTPDRLVGRQ